MPPSFGVRFGICTDFGIPYIFFTRLLFPHYNCDEDACDA